MPPGAPLPDHVGIEVVKGDLAAGAQGKGPFDVILVNGAFESQPDALIAQLAEGGRLVGVEARAGAQEAMLIEKSGDRDQPARAVRDARGDDRGVPSRAELRVLILLADG